MKFEDLLQHRKGHGKNRFIIHFDVHGIVPSFLELEVVDLVDQVDTLHRAVGFKISGKNLSLLFHWEPHTDGQSMVTGFTIC